MLTVYVEEQRQQKIEIQPKRLKFTPQPASNPKQTQRAKTKLPAKPVGRRRIGGKGPSINKKLRHKKGRDKM